MHQQSDDVPSRDLHICVMDILSLGFVLKQFYRRNYMSARVQLQHNLFTTSVEITFPVSHSITIDLFRATTSSFLGIVTLITPLLSVALISSVLAVSGTRIDVGAKLEVRSCRM